MPADHANGRESNGELPLASDNLPALRRATVFHDDRFGVQRHGRTDVPRYAIEAIAHLERIRIGGLDDQVLLVMSYGGAFRQVEEKNARVRHFRRNSLVPEVEAKSIGCWFADNARQHKGGGQKIQVRQFLSVTRVPKDARSRTAFDITPSRVHGK